VVVVAAAVWVATTLAGRPHALLISSAVALVLGGASMVFVPYRRHAPRRPARSRAAEPTRPAYIPSPEREVPTKTDGMGRAPAAGDMLGQYQLLSCVGQGGMGRVWAARRVGSTLHRLVAVKTVLYGGDDPSDLRCRFMDEARIALLAQHPNVCGVHEVGVHDNVLYQVLEWCDGASLRQVLDGLPDRRMPLPVAARIVAKVSAGLHAAHELENDDGAPMLVVHRDVSPQNIMISASGQVKVTDFGVAKADGQLHRPTEASQVKGKLSYMAPEQLRGQPLDRRADIFALGCVLYEATTGRRSFAGESRRATVHQLLSQTLTPPEALVPDYPKDLARIVVRALSQNPADRFVSAEQFGVALEEWLASTSNIVTEQTIAAMMAETVGPFIRTKAERIEQALNRQGPRVSVESETFRKAALPESTDSLPPNRPTVPAGPAARKPRATQ
jgi:eukaryotic-like serine/threonine-protein kinase